MKQKFNIKIAKEIARQNFGTTVDCITGIQDPIYDLGTDISEFEQNFTEDLEEKDIIVTIKRIEVVKKYYLILVNKAIKQLNQIYEHK